MSAYSPLCGLNDVLSVRIPVGTSLCVRGHSTITINLIAASLRLSSLQAPRQQRSEVLFPLRAAGAERQQLVARGVLERRARVPVIRNVIAGGAQDRQLDDLTSYAEDVGLAFQIADDVLNVTGTRDELGKNPNTDAERGKKTYPTFYGAEGARKLADDCVARAIARLSSFGPAADPLRELARYITSRKN